MTIDYIWEWKSFEIEAQKLTAQTMSTVTKRSVTVYGYMRLYIKQRFSLSYDTPQDIKRICCQFYGYFDECIDVYEGDMISQRNEDESITLSMPVNDSRCSKAYGVNIIDGTESGCYCWIFKIINIGNGHLIIGLADADSKKPIHRHQSNFIDYKPWNNGDILKFEMQIFDDHDILLRFYRDDKIVQSVIVTKAKGTKYCLMMQLIYKNDSIQLIKYTEE